MLGYVLHLPRVQKRAGGGFLLRFDPVHASSTSLACKSEQRWAHSHVLCLPRMQKRAGVGFHGVLTTFRYPPPPSRAKASWRWFFYIVFQRCLSVSASLHAKAHWRWFLLRFDDVHVSSTSLVYKSESEVVSTAFQRFSSVLHSLACKRWTLWHFDAVHMSSTSLTCKCEREVDLYGVSILFSSLPPPSHLHARWRWLYRVSMLLECAGGHFDTVCTSSTSLPCKGSQGGSLIAF